MTSGRIITKNPLEHKLELARRYLDLGWKILPVCPPQHLRCAAPGKVPYDPIARKHIERYGDHLGYTLEELARGLAATPQCGLTMVVTADDGIQAIDVDGQDGEAILARLSGGDLPPTWEYRSGGGGRRMMYRLPTGVEPISWKQAAEGNHQEVALIGPRRHIVLPPSGHPSGGAYEWVPGRAPWEIPIAPAPDWLLAIITRKRSVDGVSGHTGGTASSPVDRVLARLRGVRRSGSGWMALCPAHDDHHPSLSVGVGADGRVLVHCFAGCQPEQVIAAIGLEWADLYPPRRIGQKTKHHSNGVATSSRPVLPRPDRQAERLESAGSVPPTPPGAGGTDGIPTPHLPKINITGRWVREVTAEALAAVRAANTPPVMYRRGTQMVRVVAGGEVQEIDKDKLFGILDRVAVFVRETKHGEEPAQPPKAVVADILALPPEEWGMPELRGVRHAPVAVRGSDGTVWVVTRQGYDAESGIFLTRDWDLPEMSVGEALARLDDVLADFPFVAAWARAHAYALMLLPYVRHLIDGPTPLHLIDAPTPGTGKGLLAEVLARIATGGEGAAVSPLPATDEETEKRITSLLMAAKNLVLFDNVQRVHQASLAAALTSTKWQGRKLGKSEMITVPNDAVWVVTGNNPELTDEIARRTIPIRLDTGMQRPELRGGFRRPDLLRYVRENIVNLVSACVTIVRAWADAGCPEWRGKTLGSFESWSRVMGGILQVAGIDGFLEKEAIDYVRGPADPESSEWEILCKIWYDRYGGASVGAKEILEIAVQHGLLARIHAGRTALGAQQRMGHALRALRDRVYAGYRIRLAGHGRTGTAEYALVPVGPRAQRDPEPDGEAETEDRF